MRVLPCPHCQCLLGLSITRKRRGATVTLKNIGVHRLPFFCLNCGKPFVPIKLATIGVNRFCSIKCGKDFGNRNR